jgi:hypothetical protein
VDDEWLSGRQGQALKMARQLDSLNSLTNHEILWFMCSTDLAHTALIIKT